MTESIEVRVGFLDRKEVELEEATGRDSNRLQGIYPCPHCGQTIKPWWPSICRHFKAKHPDQPLPEKPETVWSWPEEETA